MINVLFLFGFRPKRIMKPNFLQSQKYIAYLTTHQISGLFMDSTKQGKMCYT